MSRTIMTTKKLWEIVKDDKFVAHIILICTKPQSTLDVCDSIRVAYENAPTPCILPTVVTMCPGITISKLESWLSPQNHPKPFTVVRTMPNTPVSIRQGATALIASQHATTAEVDGVIALFRVFSPCVEILHAESLLDVAAAVSG
jgi:pyrroline-5-carboxylate reductase